MVWINTDLPWFSNISRRTLVQILLMSDNSSNSTSKCNSRCTASVAFIVFIAMDGVCVILYDLFWLFTSFAELKSPIVTNCIQLPCFHLLIASVRAGIVREDTIPFANILLVIHRSITEWCAPFNTWDMNRLRRKAKELSDLCWVCCLISYDLIITIISILHSDPHWVGILWTIHDLSPSHSMSQPRLKPCIHVYKIINI